MSTILFDNPIFGPVHSRRLGISLGVNLLPGDRKLCSFDCLYCECGYNTHGHESHSLLPTRGEVSAKLEEVLRFMQGKGELPDVITFAGNGEPTLHRDFKAIIDDTVVLRDRYAPKARVCVLTNATQLGRTDVCEALAKTDEAILKIDSGREETVRLLDKPVGHYDLEKIVGQIVAIKASLGSALAIQTMFVNWEVGGVRYTNTGDEDVAPWLDILRRIVPPRLMIYTIDRETPLKTMSKASRATLDGIAERARRVVADVSVSY